MAPQKNRASLINFLLMASLIKVSVSSTAVSTLVPPFMPEQVHIAKGDDASSMIIAWVTMENPEESTVEFGLSSDQLTSRVSGSRKSLITLGRLEYCHEAVLTGLEPRTRYFYRVGAKKYWSPMFDFRTFPDDADTSWSPRIALFGDLGTVNGRAMRSLIRTKSEFDMFVHLGDLAYDLFSFQGRTGDQFMRAIEPMAAHVPYTVLPGNHEYLPAIGDSGRNFLSRFGAFKMFGGDPTRHTFVLGHARFVAVNSEVYFLSEGGNPLRAHEQLRWLRDVLRMANRPEERAKRPWVVVLQHRPVYCSSSQFGRCPGGQSWIRQGQIILNFPGLEDIYKHYGVDLVFSGHNHHYERSFPVYDKHVRVTDPDKPYDNARAPIYIVSGVPGNQEIREQGEAFTATNYPWSAFKSRELGYTRLTVVNATHLQVQQIATERDDFVVDDVWITKTKRLVSGKEDEAKQEM